MNILENRKVEKKTNIFLFVIFFYLIGPSTFRFANAYISDLIFALFFIYAVFTGTKLQLTNKVSLIFVIPFLIVLISNIGKIMSGFIVGVDEFANTIKNLQLYVIVALSISIFDIRQNEEYFQKTLYKFSKIISIAILYNSIIGILQYFEVEIVKSFMEIFYYIEINLADVDLVGVSNADIIILENRITGIFESWNGIGFFLTQTLFLTILIRSEKKYHILNWAIVFGLFALMLAGSRAATLGMILALMMYGIFVLKSRTTLVFITIMLFIFPLFGWISKELGILSVENIERFNEIYDFITKGEIPGTWAFRLDSWSWLPQHIISSPYFLFGYPNQVWKASVYFWGADSQYVAWLLVYGIIGFVMFLLWSLLIILKFKEIYSAQKKIAPMAISTRFMGAFVIIFITYLIIGISQDSLLGNRWREIFLAFIGFVSSWALKIKNDSLNRIA